MAFFDFDYLYKCCRHLVGILAWTWAIFVFLLSYFGRGHYNHINNNNEIGPPPFFHAVFVPVIKVLVVAPSGSFGLPVNEAAPPGSVGHHGSVQSGQRRFIEEAPVVYCAGCNGGDSGNSDNSATFYNVENTGNSGSPLLTLPQTSLNNNNNVNNNNKGFAFANNPLIDKISLDFDLEKESQKGNQNPATVQYINMNQDGQYNFAYSAADSSRQERRNLDGTVEGSYSYRNPVGRLVEIQYTAGPESGFNAYGANVPPRQIAYTPVPVQDTPAVKAAREQFLNTYAQELNRINAARAQAEQLQQQEQKQSQIQLTQQNVQQNIPQNIQVQQQQEKIPVALPLNNQNSQSLPIAGIESDINTKPDTYDDEDDTEIVYAALADSYNNVPAQKDKATFYTENQNTQFRPENLLANKDQPQNSFGFWTKETVTPGAQVPLKNTNIQGQQIQSVQSQNQRSQLPNYFYYVSVGGMPHYVTSNSNSMVRSDFPTSLRATLLGALPIAAVHDAQVRHTGEKVQQKASPPLYLDLDSNKQDVQVQNSQVITPALNTFTVVPITSSNQKQGQSQISSQTYNQNQQPTGAFSQIQYVGYPVFVV